MTSDEKLKVGSPVQVAVLFVQALKLWATEGPELLTGVTNEQLLGIVTVPGASTEFFRAAQERLAGTFVYSKPQYPAPDIAYVICPFRDGILQPGEDEGLLEGPILVDAHIITLVFDATWPEGFKWRVIAIGDYVLPENICRVDTGGE